jgi:hypothetical protein
MKRNESDNGQGVLIRIKVWNRKCKQKKSQDYHILFNGYYSFLFGIVRSWNRSINLQRSTILYVLVEHSTLLRI